MKLTYDLYNISSDAQFEACALEMFKCHFEHNAVYRSFCDLLYVHPADVQHIKEIPFLPIEFFKTHAVHTYRDNPSHFFTSSGTTGSRVSKHFVADLNTYIRSFTAGFDLAYGNIQEYAVLAVLPSYMERKGSSLIYMVDYLIKASTNKHSGFYLEDFFALSEKINHLESIGQKTLLIGVSFALLELVEKYSFKLEHTIVMETGGMKGRRKELVRAALHHILKEGFGVSHIHSEYGMTELLSQAYSKGNGIFTSPPWMKILVRDPEDPLTFLPQGKNGGLSIIDLANQYSCPFIATQDLGNVAGDGSFRVIGRFDNSDIRGCNLMVL